MTAQRQERYGRPPGKAFLALLAGFFASICLDLPGCDLSALAATTERVVVNHYSGLAIEGFDPVAYFTDSIAVQGVVDFEASESGAVWRFRNEGNRAAFHDRPDVYMPLFGGYDIIAVARGAPVPGSPAAPVDRRVHARVERSVRFDEVPPIVVRAARGEQTRAQCQPADQSKGPRRSAE